MFEDGYTAATFRAGALRFDVSTYRTQKEVTVSGAGIDPFSLNFLDRIVLDGNTDS